MVLVLAYLLKLYGIFDLQQSCPHNLVALMLQGFVFRFMPMFYSEADPDRAVSMFNGVRMSRVMTDSLPSLPEPICTFVVGSELCGATDLEEVTFDLPSREVRRTVPVSCSFPKGIARPPLVVHFHGGGLVFDTTAVEGRQLRYFVAKVGIALCSVRYRLAPEHPFPAAADDAFDAAIALLDTVVPGLQGRYDPDRFGIVGQSAGGYLAIMTALQLADANRTVAVQVPLIPMVKPFGGTASQIKHWDAVWGLQMNHWCWSMYLRDVDGSAVCSWRINPLQAPSSVLERVAPALVLIASEDALRDEGEMYAEVLRKAGKLLALEELNTTHMGMTMRPHVGVVSRSIAAVLRKHLRVS